MRAHIQHRGSLPDPSFPLLESGDLPGDDDWSLLETLRFDEAGDLDDDRRATLAVARSFDD